MSTPQGLRLPDKLNWQEAMEFAEASLLDVTRESLANMYDVSPKTIRNWIKSEWYAEACAALRHSSLRRMMAKARVAVNAALDSSNESTRLKAAEFVLSRLDPDFFPHSARQSGVNQTKGRQFTQMSDDELNAALSNMMTADEKAEIEEEEFVFTRVNP